ncbi:MAG: peptidase, partial [Pseudomonadota bacterium]
YFYGAVGITYEQSSARGLKARRRNGSTYHFRDTVRQHFVASIATAETVADTRAQLLKEFYDFRVSAIAEGESENVKFYIFPAREDSAAATNLGGLLVQQGVEVMRADEDFSACGATYDEGAIVVNAAQPAKRLIRNLLDPKTPIPSDFLKEQERLRKKDLPNEIYDVTAWSLPLMFNVEMATCNAAVAGAFSPHGADRVTPGAVANKDADVAFLVNWGDRPAARLLAHAFRRGLVVNSNDKAFTHNGADFKAGTLIFPVDENPADLADQLAEIARETGAAVIGVDDSWVTAGPNFGSSNVVAMHAPKVGMAWDAPASAYIAGNTRFVIERQFDYPVTPIRSFDLGGRDLSRFDVLILPGQTTGYGGGYDSVLGGGGKARLKNWVRNGGVLIATAGATRFLADPDNGMLSIRREDAAQESEKNGGNGDDAKSSVPGTLLKSADDFEKAIAPEREAPDASSGVLVKADVDPDHWLAAGVKPTLNVLARGSAIYTPVTLDNGTNVARFAGPEDVLLSGYLWEETKQQLAYKPFVVVEPYGDGWIIAFTQDPNVRAYLDGLNGVFMNAVFRAPAHSRKAR